MHILISNDDGYRSPGLAALAEAISAIARCTVVAPDRDRSGASNSLTLTRPVRAEEQDNGFIAVEGTPTDCVHLAINGLLSDVPEMVLAGINAGPNMGDDVLYSGTVAAAMEGRFLGLPAIAISLAGVRHYDTAARVACRLIEQMDRAPLPTDTIPDREQRSQIFSNLRRGFDQGFHCHTLIAKFALIQAVCGIHLTYHLHLHILGMLRCKAV